MSFDETLRQAFDTLTDRLRDEIAGAINGVAAELAAAAQTDRDQATAEAANDAAREADARLFDAVAAAETTARENRQASELAVSERLLAVAAREAARAGIFLVRGTTLAGWPFVDATGSASAFEPADGGPLTLDLNGTSVGVVGEAVRTAAWPSILEILTRHAARSLEALTAFKAARVLTERPDAVAPDLASHTAHEAALRYARLLVAEIKLYHEPAIAAGREERDLGSRLGGEIARARSMYEERVPADVRSQTDYFGAEIVRTLANGDTTLLGQAT